MRRVLVDASAFITLAEIGEVEFLRRIDGEVAVVSTVAEEISRNPAAGWLAGAQDSGWLSTREWMPVPELQQAAVCLGHGEREIGDAIEGDVALLAVALRADDPVVVTDDKPLGKTCKALGVPISGSIGVVIAAVERGELEPDEAKDTLVAMDEVGARLSARLLREAERLIDEAAEEREE